MVRVEVESLGDGRKEKLIRSCVRWREYKSEDLVLMIRYVGDIFGKI